MRQTLFLIPHEWIANYGLVIWAALVLVGLAVQVKRFGWGKEALNMLWVFLIGAAVVLFVLPRIEIQVADPSDPQQIIQGLPIRGFGLMFLTATVTGVGLAMRRSRQMGVDPEHILGLAFGMFITGIFGARLYYVIQYWEQFQGGSLSETFFRVVNTTQGGIVVYGALIGALLAMIAICWRRKLPLLAIGDIIVPGMAIGLALGRIGCFMNGCCYGGACDWPIAVQFPDRPVYASAGQWTPPYDNQLETGRLIGLETAAPDPLDSDQWRQVRLVEPNSLADQAGIQAGNLVRRVAGGPDRFRLEIIESEAEASSAAAENAIRTFELPAVELPRQSMPVHATQIYSAINATLLCLFLWFYYPFRYGDGEVIGLGLVLYTISRFLLELIRDDEAGQLNTALTTAQWMSLVMIGVGIGLIVWSRLGKSGKALPVLPPASKDAQPA